MWGDWNKNVVFGEKILWDYNWWSNMVFVVWGDLGVLLFFLGWVVDL